MKLNKIHHTAIICSDFQKAKNFYVNLLGLEVLDEVYRAERESYMLKLGLNGNYVIELFSFPDPPQRVSGPEACGLRHLAFEVNNIETSKRELEAKGIVCEDIRIDENTRKKFTFFEDPDGLPLELYEV